MIFSLLSGSNRLRIFMLRPSHCAQQVDDSRRALIALVFTAAIGILLIFLFPGSPEQDVDYHFLMARTAWVDHFYFVDVWGRPLFTTLFAPVAALGFIPARFFALAISLAVAWQTYRLASDLRMSRAWLVIPLLLGQQTFFELYSNLFTEPLFALVLVIALRCHISGRVRLAMLVASLLPLARPEGVFLCLFWGLWVLVLLEHPTSAFVQRPHNYGGQVTPSPPIASSDGPSTTRNVVYLPICWRIISRLGSISILASGVLLWWLAALLVTGDPLFILHNWPATWHTGMYGQGTFFSYAQRSQEFAGVILIVPFIVGLARGFHSLSWILITSVFLVLFLLHSIFVKYGLFGEAGFPRYMVSVAPAIAVLTLKGWNTISIKSLRPLGVVAGSVIIIFSILQSVHYLDSMVWARDAVAIDDLASWLQSQQPSLTGLIWSNGRMCIVLNRNLKDSPPATNRERLLSLLEKGPPGTIVFWDSEIGPKWFGTTSTEIESRGYKLLNSHHYSLPAFIFPSGRFPAFAFLFPPIPSREFELSLLQKK
jgi:hypothetical protein